MSSIPHWGAENHDDAVVAAFTRRIKHEIARGENLRGWSGSETVHGRDYYATVDFVKPYVNITEL